MGKTQDMEHVFGFSYRTQCNSDTIRCLRGRHPACNICFFELPVIHIRYRKLITFLFFNLCLVLETTETTCLRDSCFFVIISSSATFIKRCD